MDSFCNKFSFLDHYDQLTGLMNRTMFMEELSQEIPENSHYKIIIVDIDDFRTINSSLGQNFGDHILRIIACGFKEYFEFAKVYRLDGDEFGVICKQVDNQKWMSSLSAFQESFKKPMPIKDKNILISISMGVAFQSDTIYQLKELFRCSEVALSVAKYYGKGHCIIYNESMNHHIEMYSLIQRSLFKALENDEFEVFYQPQLMVNSGRITGFEALIRWNSPELGFIPPNRFIYIAEDTGLIIPIGEWVLKTACTFIKQLHNNGNDGLTISVNVSKVQIFQDNFVDMVLNTLKETGLSPQYLELEITESVLMESYEIVRDKLELLKNSRVMIALDDFGKGYSSLGCINQLSINTLKMDKIFMDDVLDRGSQQPIADLVIQMGRRMGLEVIAEGVETKEQLEYLKHNHCMKVQGFYFSKPLPRDEAAAFIKQSGKKNAG